MYLAFVYSGPCDGPKGVYRSEESAMEALSEWRAECPSSASDNADLRLAAHHVRLRAYSTQEAAKSADIGDEHPNGRTVKVLE